MTQISISRLSHVSLGVSNIDRIVGFYTDLFGLEVAHEFRNDAGERYGVFLHVGGGTFLELLRDKEEPPMGGRFRHFCLEVESIEKTAVALRDRGFEIEIRRGKTDGVLQFFIHDPDGNIIEFHEHDRQSKLHRFLRLVE